MEMRINSMKEFKKINCSVNGKINAYDDLVSNGKRPSTEKSKAFKSTVMDHPTTVDDGI